MPSKEQIERLRDEKNALPPIQDLAARVRGGESVRSLAALYGVDQQGLSNRLRHAGYRFDTGETERDALRREMKERLATGLLRWFEPWMEEAACASVDPDMWFPEKGSNPKDARAVCRGCPVLAECRAFALEHNERWGVWGNTSERERRKLMKGEAA